MEINTIVHRKLRVLAGCLLIILVGILAGCGDSKSGDSKSYDTETKAVTASECSSSGNSSNGYAIYQTCTITMPDSRRVTCIINEGSHGSAMSCDWIHADGSDYMGADE